MAAKRPPMVKPGAGQDGAAKAIDMPALCHAIADASPMPMAGLEGPTHIIRYVNPAFCQLLDKPQSALLGNPFPGAAPAGNECLPLLDRVYRTGHAETHTGQDASAAHPLYWSYAMWPLLNGTSRPLGILIQITESTSFHHDAVAMNQALLLGSLRQHELTDASDLLNTQLQAEVIVRKKAQEALIGSEKLASVGRMAATMAHEINNPLAAVMNTVFLAQNTEGLPESTRQYLEIADGELKRIAHLTRQTLGFYRESNAPATFPVAALLASTLDLLKSKIKSKQATVACQCVDHLLITAVYGELRQVLSNLLLNSLDALDDHGKIILRASLAPASNGPNGDRPIRITIADNGQGIAAATLPRIFEPFFTTKGSIGNGLGLWVSKQIIEKHGGSVRVHSLTRGPHRGTTFSLLFPTTPA